MAKIKAILDLKHPRKDGTCAIYVYTSLNSQHIWFKTGQSVLPADWDIKTQCIIGKTKEIKDSNIIINDCKARLSDIFVKYRLKHEELTPDLLRKEYANPTIDIDFYTFWEAEMKSKKDFVKHGTWKQHSSVLTKLKEFRPKCAFSELDKNWIIDFQRHCLNIDKNNKNTVNKKTKVVKVYVMLALEQEKLKKNPFDNLKIKTINPEIEFLTKEDLSKLIEKYKENSFAPKYQRVLRQYLFSCFTGLRLSDSQTITFNNIIGNTLVVKPIKTDETEKIIRIPLIDTAIQLIADTGKTTGKLFGELTDQTANKHLKKIAEDSKIDKKIKFHSSRHTFATMYYSITRDIVGLQKLLGHADLKQTMVYTHIISTEIEKEIVKLNELW